MALTDEAIEKIREMIVSGQLQPGQRLPREADLADRPPVLETTEPRRKTAFLGHHLPFVGFSFNPAFHPQPKSSASNGAAATASGGGDAARIAALETQLAATRTATTSAAAEQELKRCTAR